MIFNWRRIDWKQKNSYMYIFWRMIILIVDNVGHDEEYETIFLYHRLREYDDIYQNGLWVSHIQATCF